jgi:hypothetical protein
MTGGSMTDGDPMPTLRGQAEGPVKRQETEDFALGPMKVAGDGRKNGRRDESETFLNAQKNGNDVAGFTPGLAKNISDIVIFHEGLNSI